MNPAIVSAQGSLIRALHARRGPKSIDLGLGEPSFAPDIRSFERATEWVRENGCRYSTNMGHADVREAIAAHYTYPSLSDPENVCMMTGSQEALYIVLKTLLDPAQDELLIVEPAFPVYAKIAQIEGIAVARVTMPAEDGFAFDADKILEAIGPRTRAIVLCSPCNPTGRVISQAAVARIARALAERPGAPVYIVHDEIYRELDYTDDAGSFGRVYPYTIAINSLSKSNALTGLRIGWAIAPANVMAEVVKMHGWATSCASTFAQRVAYDVFASGSLRANHTWYERQCAAAIEAATSAGLDFVKPDGAFYLCVRVSAEDSLAFAHALIEERDVIAIPGHIFADSLDGWLRTSFVGSAESLREGYARIASLAAERGFVAASATTRAARTYHP